MSKQIYISTRLDFPIWSHQYPWVKLRLWKISSTIRYTHFVLWNLQQDIEKIELTMNSIFEKNANDTPLRMRIMKIMYV